MTENDLPKRKKNRLEHYDYSSCGVYFLTICTSKRENYFWDAPTMSRIIQQMKGYITKRLGSSIFQKLFFDHVIRNQQDYEEHLKYIYENPMRLDHHE